MSNEIIEHGYSDIKIDETREGHIEHSLLAKEHFTHYMAVADFLSKSSMVPKGMTNKPADILIAMEMGLQLGIPMMQAIQDIAVINGKPCMYGDGLLAVVQGHKDYEWIQESVINDVATCTIKRKHHEPHSVSFSKEDAKKASLWGKSGPWTQYPDRMLKMRARGFCIRDIFSDALRGIKTDEEVNDYQIDAKPIKTIVLATVEQIEEIKTLIADKDFSQQRIDAACKHYNVNDIYTLDYHQANDFISQLNKKIN